MSDWISSFISGASGLGGVFLGAYLTSQREERAREKEAGKRATLLVIIVSEALDKYGLGCARIVADDGLSEGQRNEGGFREAQTLPPTFDPTSFDVDWQSIPANYTEDVLSLPARMDEVEGRLSDVWMYTADPPDFDEYFEERALLYAELGLFALQTSLYLRSHVKLPTRRIRAWSAETYMTNAQRDIRQKRELRALEGSRSFSAPDGN